MKILLLMTLLSFSGFADQRGAEIIKKCDLKNSNYKTEKSTIEMTLTNSNGDKTTRKIQNTVLEIPDDGDKNLILFLWPNDVKGTKLLTWGHKDTDDDQWLYLPSFKRVKRISSKGKTGSFMGSEFTFEDLAGNESDKYNHDLIKEVQFNKRKVWLLRKVPKEKNSGYKKMLVWLDKEICNALKVEYYDRKDKLLKISRAFDYKKENGFYRAKRLEMENIQTGKKSSLLWTKREIGKIVKESEFSKRNLKR